MPTMCDFEDCPKCGAVEGLYVEDRYGQKRGDCGECGCFFESAGGYRREGMITKTAETRGESLLLESWFELPSDTSGCHIEYTHDSRMASPDKLQPPGIHLAAKRGLSEEVKAAIEHDSDLLTASEATHGLTLLHAAALGDRWELAAWLLEHGADPAAPDNEGKTPLHLVAELGYHMSTLLLIDREAPVEARDNESNTPLHLAADRDNDHVVLLLLSAGADYTAMNGRGDSPLRIAREVHLHERDKVVDYLLSAGELRLHIAARHRRVGKLQEELQAHTASVNNRDCDGWTPLHQAVWHAGFGSSCNSPRCDIVKLLLAHGAQVNANDNRDTTPLHLACHDDDKLTIDLLLSQGADPSAQDSLGRTPLHYAAELWTGTDFWSDRMYNIVSNLLNQGAQVNAMDGAGETPLHRAANGGMLMAVHTLLTHGGDPNTKNAAGKSPVDLATEKELALTLAVLRGEEHPPKQGPADDEDDADEWRLDEELTDTDEAREILAGIDAFLSEGESRADDI